jgi:hypothetical protein
MMDKIYTIGMIVNCAGEERLGSYKTREGAEKDAMNYMEESKHSWTPNNLTGSLPLVWECHTLQASIIIGEERLLP